MGTTGGCPSTLDAPLNSLVALAAEAWDPARVTDPLFVRDDAGRFGLHHALLEQPPTPAPGDATSAGGDTRAHQPRNAASSTKYRARIGKRK